MSPHPRAPFPLLALLALLVAACSADPIDETHQGRLEEGDQVLAQDNSFYDAYSFKVDQGMQIVIEMTSTELDPYVLLLDGDGNKVGEDDDGGTDKNARLVMAAPSSGTYTVYANGFGSADRGGYTLRITTSKP